MHKYRLVSKKGEGTFSEVLKAQSIATGEYVAVKCMKNHFKSIEQVNSLREIQALRRLNPHDNIISLEEVLYDKQTGRLALVFELMDMNIYELIRGRKHPVNSGLVKNYMYQLLKAVAHMHKNGIFHRDIKPENILIMGDQLKVADFGSCRGIYTKAPYTEYISTRWYRAPECLLTNGYYDYKMDMWGIGCVFFEIVSLFPLFPGTNELDQIEKVHAILGTPAPELMERFRRQSSHINNFKFANKPGTGIARLIPHATADCIDLIEKLLLYNPDKRITASHALRHPYFKELRDAEAARAIVSPSPKPPASQGGTPTAAGTGTVLPAFKPGAAGASDGKHKTEETKVAGAAGAVAAASGSAAAAAQASTAAAAAAALAAAAAKKEAHDRKVKEKQKAAAAALAAANAAAAAASGAAAATGSTGAAALAKAKDGDSSALHGLVSPKTGAASTGTSAGAGVAGANGVSPAQAPAKGPKKSKDGKKSKDKSKAPSSLEPTGAAGAGAVDSKEERKKLFPALSPAAATAEDTLATYLKQPKPTPSLVSPGPGVGGAGAGKKPTNALTVNPSDPLAGMKHGGSTTDKSPHPHLHHLSSQQHSLMGGASGSTSGSSLPAATGAGAAASSSSSAAAAAAADGKRRSKHKTKKHAAATGTGAASLQVGASAGPLPASGRSSASSMSDEPQRLPGLPGLDAHAKPVTLSLGGAPGSRAPKTKTGKSKAGAGASAAADPKMSSLMARLGILNAAGGSASAVSVGVTVAVTAAGGGAHSHGHGHGHTHPHAHPHGHAHGHPAPLTGNDFKVTLGVKKKKDARKD